MRKFLKIFMLLWITVLTKAQNNQFSINCANDSENVDEDILKSRELASTNCGNTSPYYNRDLHGNNLYLPNTNDGVIYVKLNFIFLTKPDGTGNFEENNPEHIEFIDNIIASFNERLELLYSPIAGCEVYPQPGTDTKIRVVVNKIWKADPAWDYLITGYNMSCGDPEACPSNQMLYPPNTSLYYYNYLDNDPTIPEGINITFSNNGQIYSDYQNGDFSKVPLDWAASQRPSFNTFNNKQRQYWPDVYNGFLFRKHFKVGDPTPTWETVKQYYYFDIGARAMVHELGHSFNLSHHDCVSNIMSTIEGWHDYLSLQDVSIMHQSASISSLRQYFTEDSFKNTNINVGSNELWDLNFRLYSNVKIDNNSSLKATCKIIMAPQSRFIVKDGSNFIIEGAEITSANNSTWNGIKVEGNGYLLINPNTLIDSNHFYAYADNTPLPDGKASNSFDKTNKEIIENTIVDKDYRIYPNPTGDFINIETKNKITKVEIYNLLNKSFSPIYKDNQVDVRNLAQGNYILKIYSNSGEKAIHFIKK